MNDAAISREITSASKGEERPVSGVERVMLRLGASMGADLVIGRVEGPILMDAFRAAATAVVKRHPTLRVRVEGQPPECFVFLPAENAPVDVEFVHANEPGQRPAWQSAAIQQTTRPFLLNGGPACRFVLVQDPGSSESAHVIIAAPHALVDGRCLMRLLDDLLVAWAAITRGEKPTLETLPITPSAATLMRFPWLFKAAAPLLRRVWLADLRAHHTNPALPPRAPAKRDEDIATIATFREGTKEGWKRLQAECRRHEVTVGGALLAATWFALAKLVNDECGSPPPRLLLDVDVDMRSRLEPPVPDTHVGYYTGFAPVGGRASPKTDFWALAGRLRNETLRLIRWRIPTLIHLLPEAVPDYFELMEQNGVDRLGGGGAGSLAAVSNVGRYPYEDTRGPFRLTGLWGFNGACVVGPALISWLRFIDGRLFYNAIGGVPAIDQQQLERFQDAIMELLENPPAQLSIAEFCGTR